MGVYFYLFFLFIVTSKQAKLRYKQQTSFQQRQKAWSKYYKPIKECKDTKRNLSNFVACTEDKKKQKASFNQKHHG